MYPVPEDSGGETGSSAADLVEDSALTAGEVKKVTKYPAPEVSGLQERVETSLHG